MSEDEDTSTDDTVCCICLAEPKEKNPLFLIACGCKGAWFHTDCENNWIDWGGNPLLCPVCRRIPNIQKEYSFHWSVGDIQQYYWRCIGISGIEICLYTYEACTGLNYALAIPSVAVLLLLLPFVFATNKPYSYYMFNINLHNFYSIFSYTMLNFLMKSKIVSRYDYPLLINFTVVMSSIHFFYIFLDFLVACAAIDKTPDCFHEFIIGRDIVHLQTLRIAESAADTREGDEGRRLMVLSTTSETRASRGRHHRD